MRIYRNSIYITGILTVISFVAAAFLHYVILDDFWCNVCLGVFGSGFLTAITSAVGYCVERKKTFEGFSYATKSLLHDINKFQYDWTLDKKIDFCLEYNDISKTEWDRFYGDFCFLCDIGNKNRNYIYTKIYKPIQALNNMINCRMWNFRWHKDESGKNDTIMAAFVKEIEDILISQQTIQSAPNLSTTATYIKSNLVSDIYDELNGHYYELMYPHIKKEVSHNERNC